MTPFDLHTHHGTGENAIFSRSFGRPYPESARFSAGLHPWYLTSDTFEAAVEWLQEQVALPHCAAVGEAGLDKICTTDWTVQERAFRHCIGVAVAHQKPLIIHCVRAYEEVLALKKEWGTQGDTIPWIFHGFNKKPAVAQMLLRAGAYLSFGAALLVPDSPAAQSLAICPPGRYFLETDDRSDVSIAAVYAAAAAILEEVRVGKVI